VPPSSHQGVRCARRGFTLVELLVSTGIITILATILLPIFHMARRHARDTRCKGNLTQIWKATNLYANSYEEALFANLETPLRVSNVVYASQRRTGWGCLYPEFLPDYNVLFCPADPARDPEWQFGWGNWGSAVDEVQCSYGYRDRQGIFQDPTIALTLSEIDRNPLKVIGADYYEDFVIPARVHHPDHINLLRCNGQVEQVKVDVSFGPDPADFEQALQALDR